MKNYKIDVWRSRIMIFGVFLSLLFSLGMVALLSWQSMTIVFLVGIFFGILLVVCSSLVLYSGFFFPMPFLVCNIYYISVGLAGLGFAYVNQAWLHLIASIAIFSIVCFYISLYKLDQDALTEMINTGLKRTPGLIHPNYIDLGASARKPHWLIKNSKKNIQLVKKINSFFNKNISMVVVLYITFCALSFLGHRLLYYRSGYITFTENILYFVYFQYILVLCVGGVGFYMTLTKQLALLKLYAVVKKDKKLMNTEPVKQDSKLQEEEKLLFYLALVGMGMFFILMLLKYYAA